ncbi:MULTISPECIES: two-component system activity regulator YycH [unclassified Enterococcus]|uniref:YycH family regulatory protein n=1 Tax=unclassified Enterococcus TaxID=2608891 RepID=UPI001555086A|nr:MULTISPECIES: two-component system activity regulator YycH [unclassified Enterococcus]MBS7577865.1 hypothetical protein [Enterococcus sp. MMGLQ5-2]MBS7585125.1 hypothetical protein [Enterococcus sp. MMGLQ5-1]NPD12981.1 hypothetical protein [Enterococcus sp. MMGLQ5-1]NPD37695.1 hypothetical protein [Enterococcus sp. MMGLQ5-2]
MERNIWIDRIRVILLIFLVSLSLFFTYNVWLHPVNGEKVTSQVNQVKDTTELDTKRLFLANQLVRHDTNQSDIVIGNSLIKKVQDQISSMNFKKISQLKMLSATNYSDAINEAGQIELVYPYAFALSDYIKYYELNLDASDISMNEFNRIAINAKQNKLIFYNDDNRSILETTVEFSKAQLTKIINQAGNETIPVVLSQIDNHFMYLYQDSVTLKKYNYIYSRQAQNIFKTLFFGNNNEIQTIDSQAEVTYLGNDSTRLIVNENTGIVTFKETGTGEKSLADSLTYVKVVSKELTNLRLFEKNNNHLQYLMFIEGYPIINDDYKGQISFEVNAKQSIKTVMTNLEAIQVPIPTDATISLKSSQALIEAIKAKNPSIKIENICIGYTWHNLGDNTQVVELVPEWFVKIDDEWRDTSDLV